MFCEEMLGKPLIWNTWRQVNDNFHSWVNYLFNIIVWIIFPLLEWGGKVQLSNFCTKMKRLCEQSVHKSSTFSFQLMHKPRSAPLNQIVRRFLTRFSSLRGFERLQAELNAGSCTLRLDACFHRSCSRLSDQAEMFEPPNGGQCCVYTRICRRLWPLTH